MAVSGIVTNGSGPSFYQNISGGGQSSSLAGSWSAGPSPSEIETAPGYDIGWYRRGEEETFQRLEALVGDALNSAAEQPTADPHEIIDATIQRAFAAAGDQAGGTLRAAIAASSFLAPADRDPAPARRRYLAALRSFSVEPQQFQHDLLIAMHDARSGHIDPSAVLRNFPIGSSLDAVA